jgi:hypothetical protein
MRCNYLENYFLVSIFLFLIPKSQAQSVRENVSQFNAWAVYSGTHSISNKWALYTDFQFRRHQLFVKPLQIQARGVVDYKLNENITVSQGYVGTWASPYGKQVSQRFHNFEHRPFQQLTFNNKSDRFYLSHRYRLEQRWIGTYKATAFSDSAKTIAIIADDSTYQQSVFDRWEFRNRVRYRFLVNVPLNHSELINHTLFLQMNNEVFIGFGKKVRFNIFDQNRFFLGLGYRFTNNFQILCGYMNHFILKGNGTQTETNHTLWMGINYNLNWSKS